MGIYSITWVFQILYTLLDAPREIPTVISSVLKHDGGVDEMASIIFNFPKRRAQGIAMSSLNVATDPDGKASAGPAIRIQGLKGEISIFDPAYRPTRFIITPKVYDGPYGSKTDGQSTESIEEFNMPVPGNGHGLFWEADEVARCLRDGKKQSEVLCWDESVLIMEMMDTVRQQCGVIYPGGVESTDYVD